jgi:3-methyladenine DNA glycosylase AlkD
MKQKELRERLTALSDEKYRLFSQKLQVSSGHEIIGVRTPSLRMFAKNIKDPYLFLDELLSYKDIWYEEVLLAYFCLGKVADKEKTLVYLKKLLPYNDGWATNDSLCPSLKVMAENQAFFWPFLLERSHSTQVWDVRFSVICMMDWYLDDQYIQKVLQVVTTLDCSFDYVMLAVAWLLATALIDYKQEVLPCLHKGALDERTRKKTIQKAIESYRIPDELKRELRSMR